MFVNMTPRPRIPSRSKHFRSFHQKRFRNVFEMIRSTRDNILPNVIFFESLGHVVYTFIFFVYHASKSIFSALYSFSAAIPRGVYMYFFYDASKKKKITIRGLKFFFSIVSDVLQFEE